MSRLFSGPAPSAWAGSSASDHELGSQFGCPLIFARSQYASDLVELRGFEPLTSCMPCLTVSSGGVPLGRVTARQGYGRLVGSGCVCRSLGALSLGLSLASGFRSYRAWPTGQPVSRGADRGNPGWYSRERVWLVMRPGRRWRCRGNRGLRRFPYRDGAAECGRRTGRGAL